MAEKEGMCILKRKKIVLVFLKYIYFVLLTIVVLLCETLA